MHCAYNIRHNRTSRPRQSRHFNLRTSRVNLTTLLFIGHRLHDEICVENRQGAYNALLRAYYDIAVPIELSTSVILETTHRPTYIISYHSRSAVRPQQFTVQPVVRVKYLCVRYHNTCINGNLGWDESLNAYNLAKCSYTIIRCVEFLNKTILLRYHII